MELGNPHHLDSESWRGHPTPVSVRWTGLGLRPQLCLRNTSLHDAPDRQAARGSAATSLVSRERSEVTSRARLLFLTLFFKSKYS